jgi:rhodanese-related sulfurtransferase
VGDKALFPELHCQNMRRRAYLAAAGGAAAGLSGCLGVLSSGGDESAGPTMSDDLPADDAPSDGYPPEFSETPEERSFDASSFGTTEVDGESVPLAPIDAVYNWYATGRARFADARGTEQYDRSHVLGAVSSPANAMNAGDDPVLDWPTGDRVVCYCGCPHHLSSIRAAGLIRDGYSGVYVIDEGFWEWFERDYPVAGADVSLSPSVVAVEGVTSPAFAGEFAWAVHEATGQMEAAPIDADGRFTLKLRFSGVSESTPILVRTPGYEVEAPLGDLAADGVHTKE